MIRKEKRSELVVRECVTEMTCDLCGRATPDDDNWCRGAAFDTGNNYDYKRVAVALEEGVNYPECGNKTTTAVDLCPDCFKTKLVPWLEAQGARPRTEEVDW